jgi:hypothetical protein
MGAVNNSNNTTRSKIQQQEINDFLQGEAAFSVRSEARAFFTVWTFITRLPGPVWVFDVAAVTLQLPPSVPQLRFGFRDAFTKTAWRICPTE